jgi:hypothetical protein
MLNEASAKALLQQQIFFQKQLQSSVYTVKRFLKDSEYDS